MVDNVTKLASDGAHVVVVVVVVVVASAAGAAITRELASYVEFDSTLSFYPMLSHSSL